MRQRDGQPPVAVQVGRYMGAGLTWAASTLLFMLLGEWLGERLGSSQLGAVIGAFAGGGAGFYWLVRSLTGAQAAGSGEKDVEKRE